MACIYWIKAPHHTDMFSEGYIGFTSKTAEVRFKEHLKAARSKVGVKHIIHNALNKYKDKISISTIVEGDSDYCIALEEKLRPSTYIGWNQIKGGTKPPSWSGKKQRPESIQKRLAAVRENLANETEEQRIARLASYKGWTEDSKANHSANRKGMKFSESHKASMSRSRLGTKLKPETILKIKESARNNPQPQPDPWNTSRANKDVWVLACEAFCFCSENPLTSSDRVEKHFHLKRQKMVTVYKKLKSGWNPLTDEKYQTWLSEYNKTKEAENATSST